MYIYTTVNRNRENRFMKHMVSSMYIAQMTVFQRLINKKFIVVSSAQRQKKMTIKGEIVEIRKLLD